VAGGDKGKILEKLQSYIGQMFHVKVIDADEKADKLIVSERAVWDDAKKSLLTSYKVGDVVEGAISALTNFGAFIKFDEVEGLIHISEIAWQRIDHPKDILKTGDKVKAQIIQIDGAKIFLSIKRLVEDPWKKVGEKYKVGQEVRGKILKVNPFGLFVELDAEIHGLAHVSSLGEMAQKGVDAALKEGDTLDFEIISIEPNDHRLGLKLASEKK
jgi:small subunit ribosomal protein S1